MSKATMRTHVVMDKDLVESIDKLVGRRARSRFLSEAAEKELKRIRLAAAARQAAGSLVGKDTPPEWDTPEGAAKWVHDSRRADQEHADRELNWG
jgi:hypothetical protein